MPWSAKDLPPAVKNKSWSAHQIEIFIHAANVALKEYGDDGKAIAVGISAADHAEEKKNASQMPRVFYCRHMQPGTVAYDKETILLDTDAIKRMVPSGVAIPVYVGHIDGAVDLKTLKEKADGYVTESFYNEMDGWAWFKFIVIDDKGHEAIKKGWSVSNAHLPTQWNGGGTKNNVPYKREVVDSNYTHLAIVPDPRYEGACIMTPDEFKTYQETNRKKLAELQNSKEKPMFKFFKTEKKEITGSEVDADSMIELKNGKTVSMKELIENYTEQQATEEQAVEINGKKVTVAELINAMEKKNKKAKKNGESKESVDMEEDEEVEGDQDIEGDDEIGQDKKNKKMKKNKKAMKKNMADCDGMENESDDDGEDKDDKAEKKNSAGDEVTEAEFSDKFFHELKNAHLTAAKRPTAPMVVTSIDGIARGKQRYGSGNK